MKYAGLCEVKCADNFVGLGRFLAAAKLPQEQTLLARPQSSGDRFAKNALQQGKPEVRLVTQRSSPLEGALRDEPNNGCEGD